MTKRKRLAIAAATWAVLMALFTAAMIVAGASTWFIASMVPGLAMCFVGVARSIYHTLPDDGGQ